MRALLDINVLLALLDPDHTHHGRARPWWEVNCTEGWASCPLTQNGYVRVASQSRYSNPIRTSDAIATLQRQLKVPGHDFWPDDISIADATIFDHGYLIGPKQITDVYLLALAVKHGGRLVTFDRGVPLKAVRRAKAEQLVVV